MRVHLFNFKYGFVYFAVVRPFAAVSAPARYHRGQLGGGIAGSFPTDFTLILKDFFLLLLLLFQWLLLLLL
jgi:hypothetical protein